MLTEETRTVCRTHWKQDAKGYPKRDCCHGCPIMRECHSGTGATEDDHRQWQERLNRAAAQV